LGTGPKAEKKIGCGPQKKQKDSRPGRGKKQKKYPACGPRRLVFWARPDKPHAAAPGSPKGAHTNRVTHPPLGPPPFPWPNTKPLTKHPNPCGQWEQNKACHKNGVPKGPAPNLAGPRPALGAPPRPFRGPAPVPPRCFPPGFRVVWRDFVPWAPPKSCRRKILKTTEAVWANTINGALPKTNPKTWPSCCQPPAVPPPPPPLPRNL